MSENERLTDAYRGAVDRVNRATDKEMEDMTRRARTVAESIRRPGGKDSKAGKMLYEMATALTLAHIEKHQKDRHGVSVFPLYAHPAPEAPDV